MHPQSTPRDIDPSAVGSVEAVTEADLQFRGGDDVDEVIYPERLGAIAAKNALMGGTVRAIADVAQNIQLLELTAGFLGAYTLQRTANQRSDEATATAGAALGFLAFGCPICNAFLLALFSSSALMTYLDPFRPLLGVVSVALFAGLLYVRSQRPCDACGTEPQQTNVHQ